jgi:hypothetical protein
MGKATRRWVKRCIYPTCKTKPPRKQKSKPQVSVVFWLVSIEICADCIGPYRQGGLAKYLYVRCCIVPETLQTFRKAFWDCDSSWFTIIVVVSSSSPQTYCRVLKQAAPLSSDNISMEHSTKLSSWPHRGWGLWSLSSEDSVGDRHKDYVGYQIGPLELADQKFNFFFESTVDS